jgi:hypothetical protein
MTPSILNLGASSRTVGKYKTRPLYPTEIPRYQLNRRRIGFRDLLEGLEKRTISCFCRYSNPGPSRVLNTGFCHLLRIIVGLKNFALLKIILRLAVRPIFLFCHKLYLNVRHMCLLYLRVISYTLLKYWSVTIISLTRFLIRWSFVGCFLNVV